MPTEPTADELRPGIHPGAGAGVVVYWRAGCGFCASLRRQLRRTGVDTVEPDIWSDPDAASFVRRHARGNETVPTVDVAGTVLVNPTARQVLTAVRHAGLAVPEPRPPWWHRRRRPPHGAP